MKIISIEDSPTFAFHLHERAKVNRKKTTATLLQFYSNTPIAIRIVSNDSDAAERR